MKTDRKTKADPVTGKLKAVKKTRGAPAKRTPKTNGKHLPMPYEHAPIGIVESSLDGRYLNVNEEFCRILGYEKEELLKGGIRDFTFAEDYPLDIKLHEQLIAGDIPFYRFEKRYLRKDGELIWTELTRSLVRDARGKALYIVSTILDINDRKAAEAQVKWQAHLLAELADAVLVTDENFIFTSWNKAAERIYGWRAEEVVGKKAQDILQTEFVATTREMAREQARVSGSFSGEVLQRRKDGTKIIVDGKVMTLRDDGGEIVGYVSVNRDITERKKAEMATRESQQRFAATYQYAPIGIVECSLDGKYLNVNEEFCRLLGYPKEELVGRGFKGITHEDDYAIDIRLHQKLVAGEIPFYRLEKRYIRKDGRAIWAEITRSLVCSERGEPLYSIGAVLDMSERKHVESVLRESAERLRLATEAARMFTWEWDLSKQMYTLADNFEQVVGFSAGLLPKGTLDPVLRLSPAEDVRLITEATQRAITEQRDLQSLQYRIIDPVSNQIVWLELSGKVVYDENGNPVRMFGVAQNITERKKTQEEIAVISRMPGENPNPVMRLMPNGEILYANEPSQHLLESWEKQIAQTIPSELKEIVTEAFHSDSRKEIEIEQNGTAFAFTMAPIREAGYVNLYGKDVTQRRRAEAALRESEERFRALVSQATAGIVETNLDGQFIFVNPKFCEMLGYSESELLGQTVWKSTFSEDLEEDRRLFQRMVAEGESYEIEKRFIQRDGSELWTNVSVSAIHDPEGKPKGGVGVVVDISERKQIEQTLARERELLERLFETMPVMVSIYDADTKAMRLNGEFERTLGWRSDEVTVISLLEALYPDPDYRTQVLQRMAAAGRNDWIEVQVKTRDGRSVDSLWSNISILKGNQLLTGIALGIDITERKRAERALTEYARQQEALYQFTDQLHQTSVLKNVFDAALDALLSALQCDRASILLYDDANVMRFVAWRGLSAEYRRATDGHSPWTPDMTNPEPICMNDVETADLSNSLRSTIQQEGIGSLAFIPLVSNGKLIGKFMIYFNAPHSFSEGEVDLSLTIAHQLAFGIERKHAEEQLRQSESRLQAMFTQAGVGVVLMEADCNMLQVNPKFCEIVGYEESELLGTSCLGLTYADDRAENIRVIDELLAGAEETTSLEKRYIRRDGSLVWVQLNIAKIKDTGGSMKQLVAIVDDITERKRAEEQLRLKESELEDIINQTPFMLTRCTRDLRYRFVSRAYAEMIGRTPDEIEGKPIAEIMGEEGFKTIAPYIEKVLQGESMEYEAEVAFQDAATPFLHVAYTPDRDGQGNILGWFASIVDISARKQAEEALRIENERFMRFINSNIVGILIADASGHVVLANDYYLNLLGVSRRDLMEGTVDWRKFTPPEWLPADEKAIQELQERGVCEPYEKEYVRADGTRVPVYITDAKLPGSGNEIAAFVVDITERKRAEEALRASEQLYRAIARSIPGGGVYVVDKDFRYLVAEGPVTEAFGLSREMLEGHTIAEVFSDERGARMEERLRRTFAGETVSFETKHNGRVFWTQQAPLHDSLGQAIILTVEITERKQIEEALRESEERFRAIIRQATAGIVRKDAEGRLTFVNQAFCNMLGYTAEDLLGKTVWEFMYEEDVLENKRSFERLMMEGVPFKFERRFLRQDGSIIWVDASVSPIMDADGKPRSAVAVEVDVTGRKQAEAALQQLNLQLEERVLSRTAKLRAVNQTLREEIAERKRVEEALRASETTARANETKLQTLFELLPVGVSFLDPDGKILQVNSALTNILKLSKDELLNQKYKSRTYIRANGTPMSLAELASNRALNEDRTIYNTETGIVVENGDVIWTSVSAAPVDVPDVGVVVATVDITDSKRAERALRESHERLRILSQRLVEVQEEERRAIARELHDRVGQTLAALNINLIIINSQLTGEAAQQIGTRLDDSMKLVAETIALVRDVMTDLRPAVLDDYGLEAALEAHLAQFISRYDIDASLEKPDQPIRRMGPSIEMTFLRIAQEALMNIARHAQATQVDLSLRQEEDTVSMRIHDNGTGIVSWQKANRPGSHGLTIMRERAEAFGGTLAVKSTPGQGTTIEVSIPFWQQSQSEGREEKQT